MDKTYLITGGTSGIGKAIATGVAKTGARVVIVSRSGEKGEKSINEITKASSNPNVSYLTADLSLMKSVQQLSEQFKQQHKSLYGLVNAAGSWFFEKEMTDEGIDKSFAVNYLGHYALTNFLLDILKNTENARVVTVGGAPKYMKNPKINLDDVQLTQSYSGMKAINTAMVARVYFGFELAARFRHTSASSIVFHPGYVKSNIGKNAPWWLKFIFFITLTNLKSKDTCESGVYVALKDNALNSNGKFFDDKKEIIELNDRFDTLTGKKLWMLSEELLSETMQKNGLLT
jgi:NAD(P)-dependent dehydrogenase (short-subunit alcohol dehydrogenase family)